MSKIIIVFWAFSGHPYIHPAIQRDMDHQRIQVEEILNDRLEPNYVIEL
jgi:hypothetical protein